MNLATNHPIPVSPDMHKLATIVVKTLCVAAGLAVLYAVLANANYMTVRQEARSKKADAQTAVDRTANFGRIITDGSGTIISWNRGMSATTGWRADQMIGQKISSVIAPEDQEGKVAQALIAGAHADGNILLRRAGSKTATVLIRAHVNTAGDYRYVLVEPAGQLNSL
jgi:PAS domain S-box-containing protein